MSLLMGLDVKGHVVVTYYYFSSLGLYTEFASMPTLLSSHSFLYIALLQWFHFLTIVFLLFFSHFQLFKTKLFVINSKLGLLVFYRLPPT